VNEQQHQPDEQQEPASYGPAEPAARWADLQEAERQEWRPSQREYNPYERT
jgi:hypothetical protein